MVLNQFAHAAPKPAEVANLTEAPVVAYGQWWSVNVILKHIL